MRQEYLNTQEDAAGDQGGEGDEGAERVDAGGGEGEGEGEGEGAGHNHDAENPQLIGDKSWITYQAPNGAPVHALGPHYAPYYWDIKEGLVVPYLPCTFHPPPAYSAQAVAVASSIIATLVMVVVVVPCLQRGTQRASSTRPLSLLRCSSALLHVVCTAQGSQCS